MPISYVGLMFKKSAILVTGSVCVTGGIFDSMYSIASLKSSNLSLTGHIAPFKVLKLQVICFSFRSRIIVWLRKVACYSKSYSVVGLTLFMQNALLPMKLGAVSYFDVDVNSLVCWILRWIFARKIIIVITNTETVNPMEMLRFDLLNISSIFFCVIRDFSWNSFHATHFAVFERYASTNCLAIGKNGWDSVFVVTVPTFAQHFPAASISKYGSFNWNKPQWNRCTGIFFPYFLHFVSSAARFFIKLL